LGDLATVSFDLCFEVCYAGLARAQGCLIAAERFHDEEQMLARVGERLLAGSGCSIPFRFAERKGLGAKFVLELNLIEALARGVVVVLGGLPRELERTLPQPAIEAVGAPAGMAGDGGRRLLGEHPAGAEGGRGDLPGVLRGARRVVSAGGPEDHPRLHRARSEGGQEAGDGAAVHRDDRARAHGGGVTESLFRRSGALGAKKDGPGDLGPAGAGARLGLEGDQGIYRSAGKGLRADRERALLCVAYETLARRGELVALELRDIEFWPNGTGQALIRRGKTDAEGQGRVAYLSRETVKWLKIWLEHAKISEGPIFRRLIGRDQIGDALHPGSIAPIFKRVAQWIGMPARFVAEVSGHSTRVGAAQDLAELDIDLAAITQAGGWKSTRMPLQYAEKINADGEVGNGESGGRHRPRRSPDNLSHFNCRSSRDDTYRDHPLRRGVSRASSSGNLPPARAT
jgi:hypothetical protein